MENGGLMNNKIASDMLELADLCGGDKALFANIAEFIANRILLTDVKQGIQELRTREELNTYVFQLLQAGGSLQPLSREETYHHMLPSCDDPFLIDRLLGHDGADVELKPSRFLQQKQIKRSCHEYQAHR